MEAFKEDPKYQQMDKEHQDMMCILMKYSTEIYYRAQDCDYRTERAPPGDRVDAYWIPTAIEYQYKTDCKMCGQTTQVGYKDKDQAVIQMCIQFASNHKETCEVRQDPLFPRRTLMINNQ